MSLKKTDLLKWYYVHTQNPPPFESWINYIYIFNSIVLLSSRLNPRRISIGKPQLTKVEKLEVLRAEIFEALRNETYKVFSLCMPLCALIVLNN